MLPVCGTLEKYPDCTPHRSSLRSTGLDNTSDWSSKFETRGCFCIKIKVLRDHQDMKNNYSMFILVTYITHKNLYGHQVSLKNYAESVEDDCLKL